MKKFQVDMKVCFDTVTGVYEHFTLGMLVDAPCAYDAAVIAYKRAKNDFGVRRLAVHIEKIEEVEVCEESE